VFEVCFFFLSPSSIHYWILSHWYTPCNYNLEATRDYETFSCIFGLTDTLSVWLIAFSSRENFYLCLPVGLMQYTIVIVLWHSWYSALLSWSKLLLSCSVWLLYLAMIHRAISAATELQQEVIVFSLSLAVHQGLPVSLHLSLLNPIVPVL